MESNVVSHIDVPDVFISCFPQSPDQCSMAAQLVIGFQAGPFHVREQYTSQVALVPGQSVLVLVMSTSSHTPPRTFRDGRVLDYSFHTQANANDSPLFHRLSNSWRFEAGPTPTTCRLHFHVDFAFRSSMHEKLVDMFFAQVVLFTNMFHCVLFF
jgi:ribosome-associated toxin RatA of RatAB toxin-antitoxin module